MIDGQRAAARRSLDTLPHLAPELAFRQALELSDLRADLFSRPPDALRLREEARVRAMWVRLRARMR